MGNDSWNRRPLASQLVRDEHHVARARCRAAAVQDFAERHAAPLRDPGPPLDALVFRDLGVLGQCLQVGERQA